MSVKFVQNIIVIFLFTVFGVLGGYYFGVKGYEVKLKTEARAIEILNKEAQIPNSVDFARFWEVWDMMNQKHIRRPLNPETLLDGAIHGMVDAVEDPYSTYLNIEENDIAQSSLNGKYEGVGMQLGYDDQDRLVVVAPLDGSPAQKVGVMQGDRIVAIDGIDTAGISMNEAVNKIRGPAGTKVVLTLVRKDNDPIEVPIIRDTITVESVKWEDKGDGIAYIRLSRFGESTNTEWANAVREIVTQMPNLEGVILDVRNNPGGYLESSVYIASEFIKNGVIVEEDFSDGTSNKFITDHEGSFVDKDLKFAVLIDGGSASASEIVAGALKEKADAILVGQRSYGKGSVQSSEQFEDGSALHVTVAKWLTPDGNWIDSHNSEYKDSKYNETDENGEEIVGGLKPDYAVEVTEEDITNERDPQLDKAIELLKQ